MTSTGSADDIENRSFDPSSAIEIGRRWVDAITRRDADALFEITDPHIAFYATKILRNRGPYSGHDGLRQWIADIATAHLPITERITDVRLPSGTGGLRVARQRLR